METPYKNPWLNLWFHPKETIRQILKMNPKKGFLRFALLIGIHTFGTGLYSQFQEGQSLTRSLLNVGFILGIALVFGILFLLVETFFTKIAGRILRGTAPWLSVRAAVSWSKLPFVISLVTGYIFFPMPPLVYTIGAMIYSIWSFVLWIALVSEVFQFSIGRTIGAFLLQLLFIVVAYVLIRIIIINV